MLRFRRAAAQPGPIILGDRARDAQQWAAAIRHYRTALARNPRNPPIWVQYGHALKESGSHAAAEGAYRRAIADDPTAADPYLHLGHVLRLQGRTEEAKAAYLRAFSIDQSLRQAAGELAALGCSAEDLQQLLHASVAADRTDGRTVGSKRKRRKESIITRADRAQALGQWEIAADLYRRALDRNPANPPIWVQYGHVLKQSGQLRDAELAYRQAVAYDPRQPDAHVELGRVLKQRGEIEAAQQAFLQAFALDSSFPAAADELSELGWAEASLAELTRLGGQAGTPHRRRQERSEWAGLGSPDVRFGGPRGSVAATVADARRLALPGSRDLRARIEACGLFDPATYLSIHEDVRKANADPWMHLLDCGLAEGRPFTTSAIVARRLAQLDPELREQADLFRAAAEEAARADNRPSGVANLFRERGIRIGVYCHAEGNFFMREFADLLVSGLEAQGIAAVHRDETSSKDETFDLRVFIAPHEFFYLGAGPAWAPLAGAANSVLYNVEQMQTGWFCRALPYLLNAPLVLEVNFQTAAILRKAGCNVVHFMPGYMPTAPHVQPRTDVSDIELVKGYAFAKQQYNWRDRNDLADRPIDLLFIANSSPRRDVSLARLADLTDKYRFLCVYTRLGPPRVSPQYRTTSTEINCALGQRAKIVLNIHRDWIGYFEWSRMMLQGVWQGACVVSDPCLVQPIFEPGVHYLEENRRHIGELIRWLLDTDDGRKTLDQTRMAGYERARSIGSMRVALAPVLDAFAALLRP